MSKRERVEIKVCRSILVTVCVLFRPACMYTQGLTQNGLLQRTHFFCFLCVVLNVYCAFQTDSMTDPGLDDKVGLDVEQSIDLAEGIVDVDASEQLGHGDPYQLVYDVKEDSSDSEPNSGQLVNHASAHQPHEGNPLLAYLPGEDTTGTGSKQIETLSSREGTPISPRSTPDISTVDQVDGKSDDPTAENEAPVFAEDKELPVSSSTQPTNNTWETVKGRSQSTSSATKPTSPSLEQPYEPSIIYRGVTYLGSTTVNAPISEIEANRKIAILKSHCDATQAIPINLVVPTMFTGRVILKDPEQGQPLAVFQVKTILFCVRGKGPDKLDCFAFNVKHKTSGIFHCHVFQCETAQEVSSNKCMYCMYNVYYILCPEIFYLHVFTIMV